MKYEIKISKAAEMLGVSESRVSQLISSGTLDSVTINGRRRISKESIEHYRDHVRRMGRPPKSKDFVREYTLMSGDYEVMRVDYDSTADDPLIAREVLDPSRCPWGVVTRGGNGKRLELNAWWRSRSIPSVRPGIDSKLAALQLSDVSEVPFRNLGLSLSDCYWMRGDDAGDVRWSDINYFDNPFEESAADQWDFWLSNVGLDSPDNTSEGALPKKWTIKDGKRILLKGCRADDQRPFNEAAATALHERLLRPGEFVAYDIVETADGPACACGNFLAPNEEYVPAGMLMETMGTTRGSSLYDRFCRYVGNLGVDEQAIREHLGKMIVCDALIANSDRHRRNFGLVRNIDTLELRIAPIFDSGNCLWHDKTARDIERGDYSFAVKPFGPQLEQQLALIEQASWFNADFLDGFAEQAGTILSQSKHAASDGRLEFITRGVSRQIDLITQLMKVLRYRL